MSFLPLVRLWLGISVLASVAGWTLSALGQLNRPGYLVCFAVFAVLVFVCRREPGCVPVKLRWRKMRHRFRRPLPFGFAVLVLLIFLGGVLYPPGNYTGLNYRLGRILQWLAHGQWFWIHTANFRMNDRACGSEWLTAPLLLFTRSDRALFLINFLPYLLLPGLIFSVFTRLGVRPRVAWRWMWLLPTGYNFLLQAGGIANDTFPAVYALAALDFGCRAWVSRRAADVWLSLLAVALLTGAKASNLPLLLPWAILTVALVPLLWRKPAPTALVVLLAALVSFLPTAVLNAHFLQGDWSGLSIEDAGMNMKNPAVGIWGNALLLLLNNFVPPLFPPAGWWNQHALSLLPNVLVAPLTANFQPGFHVLGELPTEDWAGIGFGLSVLLAASVGVAVWQRLPMMPAVGTARLIPARLRRWVLVAPWMALLAYCMKSGMVTPQRLIAPYYPLLLPGLLAVAGQSQIVCRRWWRVMAGGVWALALAVLVLTPDRPLWPAKTILSRLSGQYPDQRLLARARKVYAVYAERPDPLAGVRVLLPSDLEVVGFIGTKDDCDISLWRPLGGRRVEHFLLTDPPEQIRERVQYMVVGGFNLKEQDLTFDAWLQASGAEFVAVTNATLKVAEGSQPWYVARFK
jgi:hypothetical protein